MDSVLNCGADSWLMITAGIVTYGVIGLAGAALVKYLFFGQRSHATAEQKPAILDSPRKK